MNDVIIVGRGPSLIDQGRGEEIDSFPIVVRFIATNERKEGKKTTQTVFYNELDHGIKTTYYTSAISRVKDITKYGVIPEKGTWVYGRFKPGIWDDTIKEVSENRDRLPKYNPIFCMESVFWHQHYVRLGARDLGSKAIFTRGAAAVICAASRLRPKKIYLAGFDAFYDYTVDTLGPHDIFFERIMVENVAKFYGAYLERF